MWSQAGTTASRISSAGKQASAATLDDLTNRDHALYEELCRHVLEMCYQPPPFTASHMVVGSRLATLAEVGAAEYRTLTSMEIYGGEWPKAPRVIEDPVVRDRRTKIKQELLSLVVEVLGENSPGPALHAQQLGWKGLPPSGPGTLCAYLLKRMGLLWGVINAPVQEDLREGSVIIRADARNTYLTALLSPAVGPVVVRGLLDVLWPHIDPFDWVRDCKLSYRGEVGWLRQPLRFTGIPVAATK
jgi:hypothetical protein